MSGALDPSAPGLPIAPSGGGGGGLPTGSNAFVTLNGSGTGEASTPEQAQTLLSTSRRPAAAATTRLLWECDGASGDLANTGSLGSAGDLTAGGALVREALASFSTIGRGVRCTGASTSEAAGAGGQTTDSGAAVTVWAVIVPDAAVPLTERKSLICRDYYSPGAPWSAPYLCAAIFLDPAGAVVVAINDGTTYRELTASRAVVVGQQHHVGLTYDGTTLRAWVDGIAAGSATYAGSIAWGDPDAEWHLGGSGLGAANVPTATILRAGVEAAVWTANDFAGAVQRMLGNWQG